jgi:hypothetical protein
LVELSAADFLWVYPEADDRKALIASEKSEGFRKYGGRPGLAAGLSGIKVLIQSGCSSRGAGIIVAVFLPTFSALPGRTQMGLKQ